MNLSSFTTTPAYEITCDSHGTVLRIIVWAEIDELQNTTMLVGTALSTAALGFVLTLGVLCLSHLKVILKEDRTRKAQTTFLLIYVVFLCLLGITACGLSIANTVFLPTNNSTICDLPVDLSFLPIQRKTGFASGLLLFLTVLTTDSLLLYRCAIFYRSMRSYLKFMIVVPFVTLVISSGTGIRLIYLMKLQEHKYSNDADSDILKIISYNFAALMFLIATLSHNIVVTVMIVARIFVQRYTLRNAYGNSYGSQYTSIASMLIESASLVVVWDSFFMASLVGKGVSYLSDPNPGVSLSFQVSPQIQIIAPLLIILRVSQGKAWNANATTQITTQLLANKVRGLLEAEVANVSTNF